MADINLRDLTLGMQTPTRPDGPSTYRHDGSSLAYGKLDDPHTPRSHARVESVSQGLQLALSKTKPVLASPAREKEPQIATVSEGLNLALSRLERRGSQEFSSPKLTERKDPAGGDATRLSPPVATLSKRSLSSQRTNASSANLMGRKKDLPGKAAARFQKLVFMVAHEMGHTLRMERIFHGSDKLESRCLVTQLILVFVASMIATATAEHGWDGTVFVQDDTTLALQAATTFLTVLSLCVWYREHRIILHLTSVKIHGWLSFPHPWISLLQVTLLSVHGPPGTNPIWAILTFFRCIFIFRIFKFHPAVQGIRDSQLAAGSIPSFSPLFYFKTVIRVKPLLAMASILVIALTPVSIAYTFTERYANDPDKDTTFVGVAWELIYFAVTQQPPVPSVPSRTLCILASFVASALFTFIFTGMLSALELDAGHSAALKKAYERNLRKNHRDSAAAMIQSHYRAAKQRNPKTEVAASVARQRFKTLSRDLQAYLAEKEGGLNLTSLIYDVNDSCNENNQLVRTLTGLVEQKTEDLTKLESELHDRLMNKLASHTEAIKEVTEAHTNSIVETEAKALSSITSHFEATQALIMEGANQAAAVGGVRVERPQAPGTDLAGLIKAQGDALTGLRKDNTELHLANQQAIGKLISTQEQQHAADQLTLSQQGRILSQLAARQEALEEALAAVKTKEEEHFVAIMQALSKLTFNQVPLPPARSGEPPVASDAPNPQVLQQVQMGQQQHSAQLSAVASTQERVLSVLEKELKASQTHSQSLEAQVQAQQKVQEEHSAKLSALASTQGQILALLEKQQPEQRSVEGKVQALLDAQNSQSAVIEKLLASQEAAQTSHMAAIKALQGEVRGSNDQVYNEVQNVLSLLDAPKVEPPPIELKQEPEPPKPVVDQYAEVYIPEEQREYPQYVYETAQQVEDKKVKAIFSAFALYDLFPIIDRDRSGMLSSNEVRRITFDADIHAAYNKKERKPWPTEQMNKLQAAITKLFKGRKIQMDQQAFVTSLALVPMSG